MLSDACSACPQESWPQISCLCFGEEICHIYPFLQIFHYNPYDYQTIFLQQSNLSAYPCQHLFSEPNPLSDDGAYRYITSGLPTFSPITKSPVKVFNRPSSPTSKFVSSTFFCCNRRGFLLCCQLNLLYA